jgi:type IV pilus assembly protein PilB
MSGLPVQSIGTPPRGIAPPTSLEGRPGFLSDVIVELGFAERAVVEHAVRTARSPGTTVGRVLVESGSITEDQLAHAIAERHGLPFVDLTAYEVDPGAANLLAPEAARRHRCVPVGFSGHRLVLAVSDPADAVNAANVPQLAEYELVPVVAPAPVLETLAERLPLPGLAAVEEATEAEPEQLEPEPEPAPAPEPPPLRHDDESEQALRLAGAEAMLREAERRSREHLHELTSARIELEARTAELELLRRRVAAEERRRRLLEDRLLEVEGEMFASERAAEELRVAHRRMRASLSSDDD